jgi:hypothetical protein
VKRTLQGHANINERRRRRKKKKRRLEEAGQHMVDIAMAVML